MSLNNVYTIEETRKRILDTALKLFQTRGIADTQMKDVAEAASISRGSLYRYYKDKFSLALGVFSDLQSRNSEEFSRSMNNLMNEKICGLEKIYKTFFILHEAMNGNETEFFAQFDYYYSRLRAPKDFVEQIEEHINMVLEEGLMKMIAEGKKDGSINENISNHILFVTVINSIAALWQRLIMRRDLLRELEEGDEEKILELHTKLLFKGMMGENTPKEFREYLNIL